MEPPEHSSLNPPLPTHPSTTSFRLIRLYLITGVFFLNLFGVELLEKSPTLQGYFLQGPLLALTHTLVLGWISMIIFGALFQFIPVVFEVPLYSEKLGYLQYGFYVPGILGMIISFWTFNWMTPLLISTSFVWISILIFIYNMIRTLCMKPPRSLIHLFILTGLFYLFLTACLGYALAINFSFPYILHHSHVNLLKIHAHWGMVGWISMILLGVTLKIVPMFTLSHGFSTRPSKWAYGFLNGGLIGLSLGWWFHSNPWFLKLGSVALTLGLLCFLRQVQQIYQKRLRRPWNTNTRLSWLGFSILGVIPIAGLSLQFFHLSSAWSASLVLTYAALLLLGFFTSFIIAQLYKIIPFLVWFHTFSHQVGLKPVPLMKDLFQESWGTRQFLSLAISLPILVIGILLNLALLREWGAAGFLISVILLDWNLFQIFSWRA